MDRVRAVAVAQALLVTFLWSTSWVLIKVGLDDLDLEPLAFAGLRYTLAALVLAPLAWRVARRAGTGFPRGRLLRRVALLGVLLYAVTQGAQFAALDRLPAATVGLMLAVTPLVVAAIGVRLLGELPSTLQVAGAAVTVAGAVLYFGRVSLEGAAAVGLLVAAVGLLANALSAVHGRGVVRDDAPRLGGVLVLTTLSMGIGGPLLLAVGLVLEGVPALGWRAAAIVAWLAVVNTACAFVLWNHTLKVLTAVESSVLNNTMLVQVAVLAWLFVGESIDAWQVVGLGVAVVGILLVQLAPGRRVPTPAAATDAPSAG